MSARNPHRPRRAPAAAAVLAAAALAAGCSGFVPPRAPEPAAGDSPWERGRGESSLEVPPDLSRAGVRDAYPVPGVRPPEPAVLPAVEGMSIERDGRLRWIAAEAEPAELWPGIRDFWEQQGFALETDDPRVGVMETGWAEERVKLPVGGVRRALERLKRLAYTYGVRDRFRTRVERGAGPGVTEIYVSHQGAHEEVRGDSYAWTPSPPDPTLEAQMLGRLMHFLAGGGPPAQGPAAAAAGGAVAESRIEVADDPAGGKHIRLDEDFDRSWRLVRRALDRAGFTLNDLDRSRGFFLVRYIDTDAPVEEEKRSWLGRLAFWRDRGGEELPQEAEFRIALERGDGPSTRVVVQTAEGVRDTGESAARILAVLAERIE